MLLRLVAAACVRAGLVLASLAVTAMAAAATWGAQDAVLPMAGPRGGVPLVVEGSVGGLVAGASSAPLRLTLRNASPEAVRVHTVGAVVDGVTKGPERCGRQLTVTDWRGDLTVPAGETAAVTLRVRVGAEPGCAGVAWRLAYSAY